MTQLYLKMTQYTNFSLNEQKKSLYLKIKVYDKNPKPVESNVFTNRLEFKKTKRHLSLNQKKIV